MPQIRIGQAKIVSEAAPTGAATAAQGAAGNVNVGTHSWKVAFVHSGNGETLPGPKSNVLDVTTSAKQVDLTSVPLGPAGTVSRKIYRTVTGDTGTWKFVGSIANNSATIFTDNIADASLGADAPTVGTYPTNRVQFTGINLITAGVAATHVFKFQSENIQHRIGSIVSATEALLVSVYSGAPAPVGRALDTFFPYIIANHFTLNRGFIKVDPGDVDIRDFISRDLDDMDQLFDSRFFIDNATGDFLPDSSGQRNIGSPTAQIKEIHVQRLVSRLNPYSLLFNGNVEIWGAGVSAVPTGWALSGAGATVAKNTTAGQFKVGTASMALTRVGTDCQVAQDIAVIPGLGPAARWGGKYMGLGAWVRATVANRACIRVHDGTSGAQSAFHSGSGLFEFLTVPFTLGATPTIVQAAALVLTGDTTAQFDGFTLLEGLLPQDFIPGGWQGRNAFAPFHISPGATIAAGATVFLGSHGHESSAGLVRTRAPFKCVARNVAISTNTNPGASQSYVWTVQKDLVDTSVVVTQVDADAGNPAIPTTELEVNKGQGVQIKLVTSAGATGLQGGAVALELEEIP